MLSPRARSVSSALLAASRVACSGADDDGSSPDPEDADPLVWILDNTASIGGQTPMVLGAPEVRDGALCFDGVDDALVFPEHPIEGMQTFTVEVRFLPDATGAVEQRFVHMQETNTPNRMLIETRVNADATFYLDTYLRSANAELTLADPARIHPTDVWHWAALSYDGQTQRHFVDATEELSGEVIFAPLAAGQMSLGTRLTLEDWYKGCASELRIHARAVSAEELAHD
jgi:hypothetical protein